MAIAKIPTKQLGAAPSTTLSNVACDASVYVGSAVRFSSGILINAIATTKDNAQVIGVVESKPTSTEANIRLLGVTIPVFTGLDTTKDYYLSDIVAGGVTTSIPTTSGHVVACLGKPASETTFFVNISNEKTVRA